jgi:hypothetical protein
MTGNFEANSKTFKGRVLKTCFFNFNSVGFVIKLVYMGKAFLSNAKYLLAAVKTS